MKTEIVFFFTLSSILFIVFSSCKKESQKVTENVLPTHESPSPSAKYLIIDSTGAGMNLITFSPARSFTAIGIDKTFSCDLDDDGLNDLRFYISLVKSHDGTQIDLSRLKVENIDQGLFFLTDSIYSCTQFDDSVTRSKMNVRFTRFFSNGDTIQYSGDWRQGNLFMCEFSSKWSSPGYPDDPGRHLIPEYCGQGPWDIPSYLAIRFKGRYGWLKLSNFLNVQLVLHQWSIQK
jgi:hypothetical protein